MGIGWLFLAFIVLIITTPSIADAQTRIESNEIRDNINESERLIIELTIQIKEQNNIIREKELNIEVKKTELREAKNQARDNWEALLSIEVAEKNLIDARNEWNIERDELKRLLSERSAHYKFIKDNENIEFNSPEIIIYDTLHQDNIILLDEKIIEQNKLINENRDFLDHKNIILQQYQKESLQSWDALLSIEEAEIKRNDAAISFTQSRIDLKSLLSERSTQYKFIKEIKLDIINNYTATHNSTGLTTLIGIELSRSCEISTKCLNYSDLIYLDSSDTNNSGKFIEMDGDIRRDKSPREESWRFYDYDDTLRIIVDPPSGMADRIKMITLTNNLDSFFLFGDLKLENNTRTWQENRYVDDCENATISVKDWEFLLEDTIDYLRTGCTLTDFNSTRSEIITPTDFDPRTSPNWLYQQWVNNSKVKCLGLCFEY